MNIVAARVDDRLIHGQVMASWSKRLQLKQIVVVDDQIAEDDFMRGVLAMSAPSGMKIDILSVGDAAKLVREDLSGENTMLLFKRIGAALALIKELENSGKEIGELNLGNIGSAPDRMQIAKNIFLSDDEKGQIAMLQAMGVNVFLQMLYTDPRTSVESVL